MTRSKQIILNLGSVYIVGGVNISIINICLTLNKNLLLISLDF